MSGRTFSISSTGFGIRRLWIAFIAALALMAGAASLGAPAAEAATSASNSTLVSVAYSDGSGFGARYEMQGRSWR